MSDFCNDEELIKKCRAAIQSDDTCIPLDDHAVLRFLVARHRNIPKAAKMASKYMKWNVTPIEGCPDLTPENVINDEDPYEHIYREYMPHANVGHSKNGFPIYWEETGLISSRFGDIEKVISADQLTCRHVRQQEYMFRVRCKRASDYYKKHIDRQVIVMNLNSISYALHTAALSVFKRTLTMDEAYYPERLEVLYMINAPWFFTGIWAMVKPWIDPVTANKIHIIGGNYMDTLREHIDDSQIPAEWGGKRENFPWQYPESRTEDDEWLEKAKGTDAPVATETNTDASE